MVGKGAIAGIVVFLVLIVVVGLAVFRGGGPAPAVGSSSGSGNSAGDNLVVEDNSDIAGVSDSGVESGKVVAITSSGFSPNVLTINEGETVTFVNQVSRRSWPASAVHPTHTIYPGSGIGKCGGAEAGSIFDACRGLGEGESYSFTFNEVGRWGYHDHLRSSLTGTIVVR